MTEATGLTKVTAAETLWPLPVLLSVLTEAERWRWLTKATETTGWVAASVLTVVESLWPLLVLLSVSMEAN